MSYLGAWSIKGVDETAKALAKRSAAEAGITMGAWLDAAILRIAQKQNVITSAPAFTATTASDGPSTGSTTALVPTTDAVANTQKIFGTTIHLGNQPISAPVAALQQDLRQVETRLAEDLQSLAERVELLEQIAPALPQPSSTTVVEDYVLSLSQASYTPPGAESAAWAGIPVPAAKPTALPSAGINYWDFTIRVGIMLTLGVIAYLLGQRMGVDLSYPL